MKLILVLVLIYTNLVPSTGLRCIECYYASDPSICKHTTECGNNQQCYIREYISEENLRVFDLNCISDSICKSQMFGSGPPLVGRKKRSISQISNEQFTCCNSDLCNNHLFDQSTTSLQTTQGTDTTGSTCPSLPKDCPQGCATFDVNFCWICDLTLCTGSTEKTTSSNCPQFPKACPSGCATFGNNFCWICDLSLCSGQSVKSTTSDSTNGITTLKQNSPMTRMTTKISLSTSKETPTPKPATQMPISKSIVTKVTIITPPITKQTTNRLMMSLIASHNHLTTTKSAGCPVYPNNCPISCSTYDNNFCQICDYNMCKGFTPDTSACRKIFCVLNCGNPPVYKKDNNGCDICACA